MEALLNYGANLGANDKGFQTDMTVNPFW